MCREHQGNVEVVLPDPCARHYFQELARILMFLLKGQQHHVVKVHDYGGSGFGMRICAATATDGAPTQILYYIV